MADEINYCSYKFNKHGIHKTQVKIEAIVNVSRPIIVSRVKAFLDLITYYAKFVSKLFTITHPLNNLFKNNKKFSWSAFKSIKIETTSEKILTYFNSRLSTVLATDASQVCMYLCSYFACQITLKSLLGLNPEL